MNGLTSSGSLVGLLVAVAALLYGLNGELLQALQASKRPDQHGASPLLNLVFCHVGGIFFIPLLVAHGRWSPGAFPGTSAARMVCAAVGLSLVLQGYNYAWLSSAAFIPAGATNALFQCSIALVFLGSVAFLGQPWCFANLAGVCLAMLGAANFGFEAATRNVSENVLAGVGLGLLAAMGYAGYQVAFKYLFANLRYDPYFLAYFGALVGVAHVVLVLPLVALASALGWEPMELPNSRALAVGTVASSAIAFTVNALNLCIVMWGSPMSLPCSSALSVPLCMLLDLVLHGAWPTRAETLGATLVLCSVALVQRGEAPKPRASLKGEAQRLVGETAAA